MRFARAAWLFIAAAACSDSEGAPEAPMKASIDEPVAEVAPALIPVDALLAQLDSARGFYWPQTRRQLELTNARIHAEQFRAHGHAAVPRLVDCLSDTTTTSTYHADDMEFRYPRGALCYEVLRAIADFDHSRNLPLNREDIYVSMAPADVAGELRRAQRAWRVVHRAKAYRLRVMTQP